MPRKSTLTALAVALLALLFVPTMVRAAPAPADDTPPTIETPSIQPISPSPGDPVIVSVVVYDAFGVYNVSIIYTTDNWTKVNVVLPATYNSTSDVATATIPGQPGAGRVSYYVVAYDNSGNRGVNDNAGSYFTYDVTGGPGGPGTWITSSWGLLLIAVILAMIMAMVLLFARRKKNPPNSQNPGHK